MLDSVKASKNSAPHSLCRCCMSGYKPVCGMGFLDQRLQFFEAEGRHLFATRPSAIVGVNFYPIRARARLLAHSFEDFRDSAGFLCAFRKNNVLRPTARAG